MRSVLYPKIIKETFKVFKNKLNETRESVVKENKVWTQVCSDVSQTD